MNIALQDIVFPRSCPVCGKATKDGADICPICETELREIGSQICQKCGQPVAGTADMWCPSCAKSLREEEFLRYHLPKGGKEHYFSQARSLYRYNGPMRQSIYRLKYKNAKEYAIYYGKKMAEYVVEGAFGGTRSPAGEKEPGRSKTGRQLRRADDGGYPGNIYPAYDAIIPVPMYLKKKKKRGYNQAELLAVEIGYRLGIPVRKNYLFRVRDTAPMKELSRSERRKNLREAFAVRSTRQPAPKSVLLVDDIFTTGATADACAHALRLGGVHRIDCLCLAMEDLSV